jgi:hypothetical protein
MYSMVELKAVDTDCTENSHSVIYELLPNSGSTCYSFPVKDTHPEEPTVLPALFSDDYVCDACDRPRLPSPSLGPRGDYPPTDLGFRWILYTSFIRVTSLYGSSLGD